MKMIVLRMMEQTEGRALVLVQAARDLMTEGVASGSGNQEEMRRTGTFCVSEEGFKTHVRVSDKSRDGLICMTRRDVFIARNT